MDHCERCQQEFEANKTGIVVNPSWRGQDDGKRIHEIEFLSGPFAGQIYYIDTKNSSCICHPCLVKDVESGNGFKKEILICNYCKKPYSDLHGWEGETIPDDGIVLLWYGSRHDGSRVKYSKPFEANKWYCYNCLDQEVSEGRATKV